MGGARPHHHPYFTTKLRAEKYFLETPPPAPSLSPLSGVLDPPLALTRCPKHFRTSSPALYVFSWWLLNLLIIW